MKDTKDVFGKPREYKGLKLYPVKMSEAIDFYKAVQCLMIPKNATNNLKVLQMTYLRFLFEVMREERSIQDMLSNLLELVFKSRNLQLKEDENRELVLVIDDVHVLRERDFDKIKTIISEQNLVDLNDEFINPEVKAKIDEARAFMAKKASKSSGLDQQITAYHCIGGFTYDVIENLTIYQFQKGLSRFDRILGAEAILNARYSGMVSFKDEDKIPHWLDAIEENTEDPIKLDAEKYKQKATKDLGMVN